MASVPSTFFARNGKSTLPWWATLKARHRKGLGLSAPSWPVICPRVYIQILTLPGSIHPPPSAAWRPKLRAPLFGIALLTVPTLIHATSYLFSSLSAPDKRSVAERGGRSMWGEAGRAERGGVGARHTRRPCRRGPGSKKYGRRRPLPLLVRCGGGAARRGEAPQF